MLNMQIVSVERLYENYTRWYVRNILYCILMWSTPRRQSKWTRATHALTGRTCDGFFFIIYYYYNYFTIRLKSRRIQLLLYVGDTTRRQREENDHYGTYAETHFGVYKQNAVTQLHNYYDIFLSRTIVTPARLRVYRCIMYSVNTCIIRTPYNVYYVLQVVLIRLSASYACACV